jgi:hypothetical protein
MKDFIFHEIIVFLQAEKLSHPEFSSGPAELRPGIRPCKR